MLIVMRTLLLLASVCTLACAAQAADVTGKWTARVPSMADDAKPGATDENTFIFKADGKNLSGSVNLGFGEAFKIQDGKIEGDQITFTVTAIFGDASHAYSFDLHFSGKISRDTIAFSRTMEGDDYGTKPLTFTAKRVK